MNRLSPIKIGSPSIARIEGLFVFVAKQTTINGERGEDEMFFREGILLHLDKKASCASYSATGTFRVWRAAQTDRAMIP